MTSAATRTIKLRNVAIGEVRIVIEEDYPGGDYQWGMGYYSSGRSLDVSEWNP